jgi:Tfp pilus assembly protein PilF
MRIKFGAAVLLLLIFAGPIWAQRDRDTYTSSNQTLEISGQINIAGTTTPARDVTVRLERFSGGIVDQMPTDARGRFRFGNLTRGYYRVVVNAPGFAPTFQDADLTVLFKAYLVFALNETRASSASTINLAIDARVPGPAREEFARGQEAVAKKQFLTAVAHLEKAISLYPRFAEAEMLLANAFLDLRDWSRAEASFRRALDIRSNNAPALVGLGESLWRQNKYVESEQALLDGLKFSEASWHGHFTLARMYWSKGETLKAGHAIGRTLQLKPDFAEAHLLAGNILLKLNQPERAATEYEEYLRLAPKGEFAVEARNLVKKLRAK